MSATLTAGQVQAAIDDLGAPYRATIIRDPTTGLRLPAITGPSLNAILVALVSIGHRQAADLSHEQGTDGFMVYGAASAS